MRFTILGFSQVRAVELGLSLEALMILRWFTDFKNSGGLVNKYVEEDDELRYWITYKKIIEDIPLLVADCSVREEEGKEYKGSKEERLFYSQKQKIKRIFSGELSKVLTKHVYRDSSGTFLYVSLNEEVYLSLLEQRNEAISSNDNVVASDVMDCKVNKCKHHNDSSNNHEKSNSSGAGYPLETDHILNFTGADEMVIQHCSKHPGSENNTSGSIDMLPPGVKKISGNVATIPPGVQKTDHTKINTLGDSSIKDSYKEIYSRVIDHLNKKANTNYKSTTKKTCALMRARIGEGFTCDDFIAVIDNKVMQWKGTDMEQYLRPETLFGTKFESYLNQKVTRGGGDSGYSRCGKQIAQSRFDFSKINGV